MSGIRKLAGCVLMLLMLIPVLALSEGLFPVPDEMESFFADDIETSLAMQLKELNPFVSETAEKINRLLTNIQIDISIASQGQKTGFSISAADTLLAQFEQIGDRMTTSLLPGRVLKSGNAVQALLLNHTEANGFDLFSAVKEAEVVYTPLREMLMTWNAGKKANYTIKGVGSAKWGYVVKLNKEQCTEILPLLIPVLSCGLPENERGILSGITLKTGFTVALYRTAKDGEDIALYAKGAVFLADGTQRLLSYQWAFLPKENKRADTYKLELGQGKNNGFSVNAKCSKEQKKSDYELNASMETIHYFKEGNQTYSATYALKGENGETSRSLQGTITVMRDSRTTEYAVDLTADGSALGGTASLTEKEGKIVTTQMEFLFQPESRLTASEESTEAAEGSAAFEIVIHEGESQQTVNLFAGDSSLFQNEENQAIGYIDGDTPATLRALDTPEQEEVIALAAISPEEQEALIAEMAQRLAGRFLIALSSLSEEDTALLQNGMSPENYQLFLQMIAELSK